MLEAGLFDIIVIGGGPVGSYVAGKLAGMGYSVSLLDKKAAPGVDVCCTGIIGKKCLDLFQPPVAQISSTFSSATFVAPSGATLNLSRPEPVAWMVDRVGLETALVERAVKNGAQCAFGTEVIKIDSGEDHISLRTRRLGEHSKLEGRFVVFATGYRADLLRQLNLGQIEEVAVAAQARVPTQGKRPLEIFLDQRLAPGGFGWLAPDRDGSALVGVLARRNARQGLGTLLERLKKSARIRQVDVPVDVGVIPLEPLPKTVGFRFLVVGEAAGQVKPTTGGGLYYGLLCANLAIQVLSRALREKSSPSLLEEYEVQWRNLLSRELAMGGWARGLWRRLDNDHIELLIRLGKRRGLQEFIASQEDFSFDWHGALLKQAVFAFLNGSANGTQGLLSVRSAREAGLEDMRRTIEGRSVI